MGMFCGNILWNSGLKKGNLEEDLDMDLDLDGLSW